MRLALILALLTVGTSAIAQQGREVQVDGYYKQNGTYVQPHQRTAPNNTTLDNYNTNSHITNNPYGGQQQTRQPRY